MIKKIPSLDKTSPLATPWLWALTALAVFEVAKVLHSNHNLLLHSPTSSLWLLVYAMGSLSAIALFFIFIDQSIYRLMSMLVSKEGIKILFIGIVLVAIQVIGIVIAEDLVEKVARYRQFFVKTAIGAPLFSILTVWPYVEVLRKREGLKPIIFRHWMIVFLWFVAVVGFCWWVDANWRPKEYFGIHCLLKGPVIVSLFWLATSLNLTRKIVIPIVVVCIGFLFFLPNQSQIAKSIIFQQTLYSKTAWRIIQMAFDGDRDGYSSFWGGNDADDGNEFVNPSMPEIPGNGVDDNGFLGDPKTKVSYPGKRFPNYVPRDMSKVKNVIMLTLCTFRTDYMQLYGSIWKTTPNLMKLARDSVVFEQAYTSYPGTPYGVGSMMNGKYVPRIIHSEKEERRSMQTLATILNDAGYYTATIYPSGWFMKKLFWAQGFDYFDNTIASRDEHNTKSIITGESVIDKGIQVIQSAREPFFLHMLIFDPHESYMNHSEFSFGEEGDVENYLTEMAYSDRAIGRLLDFLKKNDMYDNTLFIIAGDHGEEFYDHGGVFHANALYEESVKVTLLMKSPILNPTRINQPVSTISIFPTVLDILQIPMSQDIHFDQDSLTPLLFGKQKHSYEPIYLAGPDKRAIREGDYKLIFNLKDNYYELYNLANDPREKNNLVDQKKKMYESMKRTLLENMDHFEVNPSNIPSK